MGVQSPSTLPTVHAFHAWVYKGHIEFLQTK